MNLIIYPLLNTRSKRAITRVNKRYGWYYTYNPRQILVSRLAQQLGWSHERVREQIRQERDFLIKHSRYY